MEVMVDKCCQGHDLHNERRNSPPLKEKKKKKEV